MGNSNNSLAAHVSKKRRRP